MRRIVVSGGEVEICTDKPVTARSASDKTDDWPFWFVTDDGRRNVMAFPGGQVLCSREFAERIAQAANGERQA